MNNNITTSIDEKNLYIKQLAEAEHQRLTDQDAVQKISQDYQIRAAGYVRVSTKAQANQNTSIPEQKDQIIKKIKRNRWVFAGMYDDAGFTGTSTNSRENFKRMISDAKEKKFDVIISWASDRLARNTDEMTALRILLRNYGVQATSIIEPISIIDPRKLHIQNLGYQKLMEYINDFKAEQDNHTRTKRLELGKTRKAKNGYIPCKVPFGYKKVIRYKND